ncbi:MAG TPA: hypothetical protein VNN79_11820 [Actinomycetota bacterium]|nr:hypothetical protein [Actinomycetota bacterium]
MKSISVDLLDDPTDRTVFYRASDASLGVAADSDHVKTIPDGDFHAASALAAQAVSRLGERLEAGE